jgi:polyferredoxin
MRNRGWPAWVIAILLTSFYVVLYFDYKLFGRDLLSPLVQKLMPLSDPSGRPAVDKWTLYGLLYTLAVIIGGVVFMLKNRRSPYHLRRTLVIIGVQLLLAFLIPGWMRVLSGKSFYFSYLWPLKIDYFYPKTIFGLGLPFALYSFLASLVMMPLLAFFVGKRWYCSWVCGCGGLANTLGDTWRHLSSKTRWTWRLEMVTIHSVLILALVTTALVLINWGVGKSHPDFASFAFKVQEWYGFWIGAMFAGAVGVSVYPLLGTRVWCRFGCPMAAVLGLIQRIGRFQITSQGEMCIACGNCSHYCEMGIDVRSYAMRGEPIKRASCVGCGMCAHVCPRGVLRLENRPTRAL